MIALARKYRPRRFADVAVQSHVSNTLKGAIARHRVAHGYLLCGPRGVGKTTLARVLAMALNCDNKQPDGEPCGSCASCQRIWSGGASLDVVEIDAASNRGVDDARELRERAMYAPSGEDRHKVLICREIDTNFDGIKDVFRTYNEKGEAVKEEADSNYNGKIDTITAVDEHTVEFALCSPDPAFLAKIAFGVFGIQPAEHLEETGGAPLDNPIGTGPWVLNAWNRGESIVYDANPNYWGQVPAQGQLVLQWAEESASRVLALKQ